jgi:hypothetical protein
MDYGFAHEGKVFTPSGTELSAADNAARNAALTAAELAHWSTQPDTMIGYFDFPAEDGPRMYRERFRPLLAGAKVSTWMGDVLGVVIDANVYRHNLGGRFVSLRIRGNNGAVYHGRASWDGGTVIRLRKAVR